MSTHTEYGVRNNGGVVFTRDSEDRLYNEGTARQEAADLGWEFVTRTVTRSPWAPGRSPEMAHLMGEGEEDSIAEQESQVDHLLWAQGLPAGALLNHLVHDHGLKRSTLPRDLDEHGAWAAVEAVHASIDHSSNDGSFV